MTVFVTGIVEAAIAPLFMVLGFYAWDHHWNGSPFALNMFKCNLATIGFILVVSVIFLRTRASISSSEDGSITMIGGNVGIDVDGGSNIGILNISMLMLSSILGIVLGDYCWLEGMRILSARKIILIDTLKPFLAAYVGWVLFDEQLKAAAWIGLAMTVGGVLLVELEQQQEQPPSGQDANSECKDVSVDNSAKIEEKVGDTHGCAESQLLSSETDSLLQNSKSPPQRLESYAEKRHKQQQKDLRDGQNTTGTKTMTTLYGYAVALSNVVLHTCGATLTKMYGTGMSTWLICLIRFGFAGVTLAMISIGFTIQSRLANTNRQTSHDDTTMMMSTTPTPWYQLPTMPWKWWGYVCLGVLACTFIMPALINDAIFEIPLALLLTLESIGPLYSLPISSAIQKSYPTFAALLGALLAVTGIAILSFKGMGMNNFKS